MDEITLSVRRSPVIGQKLPSEVLCTELDASVKRQRRILPPRAGVMEGICFQVKPRDDPARPAPGPTPSSRPRDWEGREEGEDEEEKVQYRLTLVGSLAVHPQTTMAMLPWVVAEIRRPRLKERGFSTTLTRTMPLEVRDKPVLLQVSASWVRCMLDVAGPGGLRDPLRHTVLFEQRPHRVAKLIRNSQEPSTFGCLLRDDAAAACYVFRCLEQREVPEIISTLRQASKSSARQEEAPAAAALPGDGHHSNGCQYSPDTATAFAKKFEVLFCGRVVVAHKHAPPALIDECIEKFGRAGGANSLAAGIRRAFSLTQVRHVHRGGRYVSMFFKSLILIYSLIKMLNAEPPPPPMSRADLPRIRPARQRGETWVHRELATRVTSEGWGGGGQKPLFFRRDPSFPTLQALDENGLSPELQRRAAGVQPTSLQENRTMLFMIGHSQIFLVSPDSKKVAIEKSFREISFCSQGIRHVDHFGFICREFVDSGSCQFVCYVFQCTNETLFLSSPPPSRPQCHEQVDEIMLTLKQAFSVAALQKSTRAQSLQCDSCPMQQLHRLCDRIEGLPASKAKLELQKHVAGLDNQEQASVFETTLKSRPKSDQEENELIVSCLRRLYEERQKTHVHTHVGQTKQEAPAACEDTCAGAEGTMSSSRLRLEQLKSRAKRSLTESLEGIWKSSSKSRSQREIADSSSSMPTLSSVPQTVLLVEPPSPPLHPSSPLRAHSSTGDLKRLEARDGDSEGHDLQAQGFRKRASTIGYSPSLSPSSLSVPTHLSTAATKPKLVRHYSVSTDSPHQSNCGAVKGLSHVSDASGPPYTPLPPFSPPLLPLPCPRSTKPRALALEQLARPHKRSPSGLNSLRAKLHSASSVPNFLKFLATVEEHDDSSLSLRQSDVAALSSPGVVGEHSPLYSRRHSWRQQIFLRVATPQKGSDTAGPAHPPAPSLLLVRPNNTAVCGTRYIQHAKPAVMGTGGFGLKGNRMAPSGMPSKQGEGLLTDVGCFARSTAGRFCLGRSGSPRSRSFPTVSRPSGRWDSGRGLCPLSGAGTFPAARHVSASEPPLGSPCAQERAQQWTGPAAACQNQARVCDWIGPDKPSKVNLRWGVRLPSAGVRSRRQPHQPFHTLENGPTGHPPPSPACLERGETSLEVGGRLAIGSGVGGGDCALGVVPEEMRRHSRAELRELWRKAILQQILLLRMERENQKLQASENDLQSRRLKLDYEEITPCLKDVTLVWEKMLSTAGRSKVKFDTEKIHTAVGQGVPRQHRGEIWKFLSEQYLLRQQVPSAKPPNNDTPYKELLKQLTSQQHAILIDLGRTFPTHPYFSAQLGAGQLSLYNLLKAYSLLDTEVGYCQGLSFVAGVLLLHMSEEDAFSMLKFLMFERGLRKQYRPDMIILQIQMYQLSRLLHDYHRELYSHLEQHEIGPSLYAAPWFLTAFASHFPLGFVARVFDMLFLQGSEVIFKVALSLLGSHKPLILQHDNLESIVDFIKSTLPNLGLVQMEKTINQVFEMDISKQLQAYEVEYHVLQDELLDGPSTLSQSQRAAHLEKTNGSLRQQNLDLLEEVQVANARIRCLESRVEGLATSEAVLRLEVSSLQHERAELQHTVARLQALLASHGIPHQPCPSEHARPTDATE
ncbi:hypothetical protein P4O66_012474 [Electrophorus voltai]|uniref:TBC1 domain family member 1 n=1 Tax=Electrophorus voltai TaxID=2609070 RepID=A0AAD8Z6T2_9TELE|nr:hypothetical protein P4O66_012474 [Electrophorus voltai]